MSNVKTENPKSVTINTDVSKITRQLKSAASRIPEIPEIKTADQAAQVEEIANRATEYMKKADEFFDENIKLANKLHKNLIGQKKTAVAPIVEIYDRCKKRILDWQIECRKIEAEAQRKEDERAKREAAKLAEKNGDQKEAEAIRNGNIPVVSERTVTVNRGISNMSIRENWVADITDMRALVKAVAAGKAPMTYLLPNTTVLNRVAKANKSQMNVPGVVARNASSVTHRRK